MTHKLKPDHLYLKQGEMAILLKPTVVTTILGSCVAVTLYNPRLGIAAISHSLLPHCTRRTYQSNVNDLLSADCQRCAEAYRYVDCSVSMMAEAFFRFGSGAAETHVQIYGGAKMIVQRARTGNTQPVGLQNSAVAQKVIEDHGLKISTCDIGGTRGRKIIFNTKTGIVLLHKMDSGCHRTIGRQTR